MKKFLMTFLVGAFLLSLSEMGSAANAEEWNRVSVDDRIDFTMEMPVGMKNTRWEIDETGHLDGYFEHETKYISVRVSSFSMLDQLTDMPKERWYLLDGASQEGRLQVIRWERERNPQLYNPRFEKLANGHTVLLMDEMKGRVTQASVYAQGHYVTVRIMVLHGTPKEREEIVKRMIYSMVF